MRPGSHEAVDRDIQAAVAHARGLGKEHELGRAAGAEEAAARVAVVLVHGHAECVVACRALGPWFMCLAVIGGSEQLG